MTGLWFVIFMLNLISHMLMAFRIKPRVDFLKVNRAAMIIGIGFIYE